MYMNVEYFFILDSKSSQIETRRVKDDTFKVSEQNNVVSSD